MGDLKISRGDMIERAISSKGTEYFALTDRGRAYIQHIAINLGAVTIEQYADYLGCTTSQLKSWIKDVPEIAIIMNQGRTYQIAELTNEGIRYALAGERNSPVLIKFFLQSLAPEVYGDNPTNAGTSPILKDLGIAIAQSVKELKTAIKDNQGNEVLTDDSGHVDSRP